jgi:ornithine cyclodeaminase
MSDAIALMKTAFSELSAGRTASPLRTVIQVDPAVPDTHFLSMPGSVPALGALGLKMVSVVGSNTSRGLPTIRALVCMVDPVTGEPLAIMDGTYLTALRTGAVSGAATDLMSRPDSRVVTAIGAGAQGVTQVAAVCTVRPIERILAVDVSDAQLERFRTALTTDWPDLADRLETTTDAASAVRQADVICTATTSKKPVFDDADVRPGTHVNGIGAFTPEMQELPAKTVIRARVVVDAVDAALAEAGDLIIPLERGLVTRDHFARELGTVASGQTPGRTSAEEITLFKSVGNAVQDVAVGRRAVDRARELGLGATFSLE